MQRDYLDGEGFADVRLLDGGRDKWIDEGRPLTTGGTQGASTAYPVVDRDDATHRIFRDEVLSHLGRPLVDIRSPQEFSGERTSIPDHPNEGVLRGGHIPGAVKAPWARAVRPDGKFRSRAELDAIYRDELGLFPSDPIVTYCRIGERSSHT